MKKYLALLLCMAMLMSLAACGGSETPAPTTATTPATVPTPVTDAPTDAPTQPPAPPVQMTETVLVNNDQATFTIKKAETSDHTAMQLQVQCVNKSDRALMFSWDMVSVCGYMYDPFWAEEVAAGKTANSTVYLDTYELEEMGIHAVDEISFTLRIVDSENWMEEPIVQQAFTIYPTGLNAETVQLPQRTPTAGQVVVADDENVRFIIEKAEESSAGYVLSVYMENKTDRNLMYTWDMVSVNDMMVDPFWSTVVPAGKKACATVNFFRSELADNGITNVKNIEFTLLVSDYDDWEGGNLLETGFVYRP